MRLAIILVSLIVWFAPEGAYAQEMTWQKLESIKLGMDAAVVSKIIDRPVKFSGNMYEFGNLKLILWVSNRLKIFQIAIDETEIDRTFNYFSFKAMLDAEISRYGKCHSVTFDASRQGVYCNWELTRLRSGGFSMYEEGAVKHVRFVMHDDALDGQTGPWRLR